MEEKQTQQIRYFIFDVTRENGNYVIGGSIGARDESRTEKIIRQWYTDIVSLNFFEVPSPITRLIV